MKCTRQDCDKEAEYVIHGMSVCKEHKENKPDKEEREEEMTMGERMVSGSE